MVILVVVGDMVVHGLCVVCLLCLLWSCQKKYQVHAGGCRVYDCNLASQQSFDICLKEEKCVGCRTPTIFLQFTNRTDFCDMLGICH